MSDVSSDLAAILRDDFDVAGESIQQEMTLDDLGVDSVSAIELIDILQERFGITISDEELTNKNTIEQVISLVEAKVGV